MGVKVKAWKGAWWLFVDHEAREQIDPKGVRIRGARITGSLDLSNINALFPLFLVGCRLEQDLDLKSAKMLKSDWISDF